MTRTTKQGQGKASCDKEPIRSLVTSVVCCSSLPRFTLQGKEYYRSEHP